MSSSVLELIKQSDITSGPRQVPATGNVSACRIILTFPENSSSCTEILFNFDDIHGAVSDKSGTEGTKACSTIENLHEVSNCITQSGISMKSEPIVCSEECTNDGNDQETVYVGLDHERTAARNKIRKKSDRLIRTLPILARFSKRLLNLRTKRCPDKHGEKGEFERGDSGEISPSNTCGDERDTTPRQKLDEITRPASSRTSFTFLKSKAPSWINQARYTKKSSERKKEKQTIHPARKSKSGGSNCRHKLESFYGCQSENKNFYNKVNVSADQLEVGSLSLQREQTWRRSAHEDIRTTNSYERPVCHKYAEENLQEEDQCRSIQASIDYQPSEDKTSVVSEFLPELTSMSSPQHLLAPVQRPPSQTNFRTKGHGTIDKMFLNVMKSLLTQENHEATHASSAVSDQDKKHGFMTGTRQTTGHAQSEPITVSDVNKNNNPNTLSVSGKYRLSESTIDGPFSEGVMSSCVISKLNVQIKTRDSDRANACCVSKSQSASPDSNNSHYCYADSQDECSKPMVFLDAASSSDESGSESFGLNEDLLSEADKGFYLKECDSKTPFVQGTEMSLQGWLPANTNPSTSEEKPKGSHRKRTSKHYAKCAILTLENSLDLVSCSSDDDTYDLQPHHERNESSYDEKSDNSQLNSVITKTNYVNVFAKEGNYASAETGCAGISDKIKASFYSTNQTWPEETKCAEHMKNTIGDKYRRKKRWNGPVIKHISTADIDKDENGKKDHVNEEDKSASERDISRVADYATVIAESSKLHRIFSKSAGKPDSEQNVNAINLQEPEATNHSEMVALLGINTNEKAHSSKFEENLENVSEFEEIETPNKDIPTGPTISTDKVPLLFPLVAPETRKHCMTFAASCLGKARSAISKSRSRSLSPVNLRAKIKGLFVRDPKTQAVASKSCSISGEIRDSRSMSVPVNDGSFSEISRVFPESEVNKVSIISKEPCDTSAASGIEVNDSKMTKHLRQLSRINLFRRQISSLLTKKQEDQHLTESSLDKLSDNSHECIKHHLAGSKLHIKVALKRKGSSINCATGQQDCVIDDDSKNFERDKKSGPSRAYRFYPIDKYKGVEEGQSVSTPVSVIRSPVLESIAEVDSFSEESAAGVDGEDGRLMENDNLLANVFDSTVASFVNESKAVLASDIIGSNQIHERKLNLQFSSSNEDCKRDSEDIFSLYDDASSPPPMKTHSLMSARESAHTEFGITAVMSFISQEVSMKRYPSCSNLTDLHDDDFSVSSMKTSEPEIHNVIEHGVGEESLTSQMNLEIFEQPNASGPGACRRSGINEKCSISVPVGSGCCELWQTERLPSVLTDKESNFLHPPNSSQIKVLESCNRLNTMTSLSESTSGFGTSNNTETNGVKPESLPNKNTAIPKLTEITTLLSTSQIISDTLYMDFSPGTSSMDPEEMVTAHLIEDYVLPSPPNHSLSESNSGICIHDPKQDVQATSDDLSQYTYKCEVQTASNLATVFKVNDCRDRLKILRSALIQDYSQLDTDMSSGEVYSNSLPKACSLEGRQLLNDSEQTSLTSTCNDLPYQAKRTLISEHCTENLKLNEPRDDVRLEGVDISRDLTLKDKTSGNNLTQTKEIDDVSAETHGLMPKMNLRTPQDGPTQESCSENAFNVARKSANLFQINTVEEDKGKHNQSKLPPPKCLLEYEMDNFLDESGESLCKSHQPLIASDSFTSCNGECSETKNKGKFGKIHYSNLLCVKHHETACFRWEEFGVDEDLTDKQCMRVFTPVRHTLNETGIICDDDADNIFNTRHDKPGREPMGQVKCDQDVPFSTDDNQLCRQIKAETFLDTCNSCLSDEDSEDTVVSDKCSSSAEQLINSDTSPSAHITTSKQEIAKVSAKSSLLTCADSRKTRIKSASTLAKTLKTKKSNSFSLNTRINSTLSADLRKQSSRSKTQCYEKTIKVPRSISARDGKITELVSLNPKLCAVTNSQFKIAAVSSIFGAPDKIPTYSVRPGRDTATSCKSSKPGEPMKRVPENDDADESDTLTTCEMRQFQDSDLIKVSSSDHKSSSPKSGNVSSKSNSSVKDDDISDVAQRIEMDDKKHSSFEASVNISQPCTNVEISGLDLKNTTSEDNCLAVSIQTPLSQTEHTKVSQTLYTPCSTVSMSLCSGYAAGRQDTISSHRNDHQNMVSKLKQRLRWYGQGATKGYDFVSRSQHHLERCDQLIRRSAEIIKRSREITCNSQRQLEYTAEIMNLKKI